MRPRFLSGMETDGILQRSGSSSDSEDGILFKDEPAPASAPAPAPPVPPADEEWPLPAWFADDPGRLVGYVIEVEGMGMGRVVDACVLPTAAHTAIGATSTVQTPNIIITV